MKNRLSAAFLALALCLGPAVPALAAEADPPKVSFDLPDGYTVSEETAVFQLRRVTLERGEDGSYICAYEETPVSEEITYTAVPLESTITFSNVLYLGDDLAYRATAHYYSDPDGDGIYEERLYQYDLEKLEQFSDYPYGSYIPLTEKGPFLTSRLTYTNELTALLAGFATLPCFWASAYGMRTSTDSLDSTFGPNTLMQLSLQLERNGKPVKEPEEPLWLLSTGKPAPFVPMPSGMTVTVTTPDGAAVKQDMELTLRNITEECYIGNKTVEYRSIYTRSEETEAIELKDVPVLTEKGTVDIQGVQDVPDGQEPWSWVTLSAWSDPDGDGVYDQHMFTFYHHSTYDEEKKTTILTDAVNLVPLSQPGPFSFSHYMLNERSNGYSHFVNLSGDGTLFSYAYKDRSAYTHAPSSITLDGNYLTWLFGPDTLIKIQPIIGRQRLYDSFKSGPAFYCYIPKDAAAVPAFTDVPDWCRAAVDWAVKEEITTGTSYYKFSPDATCTNAMILTLLWRAAGEPGAGTPCPVKLPASLAYAEKALGWAAELGMVDEALDPQAGCTRASAVNYIWQAFGREDAAASGFADVAADAEYAAAVNWAVENGIAEGYPDGSFRPATICNRGVIAALLHRAYVPEARLNAE